MVSRPGFQSENERASGPSRRDVGTQGDQSSSEVAEAVIFRHDGETTGCVPRQPDDARQRGRERPAVATLGGRAVKGCEMSCGLRAP